MYLYKKLLFILPLYLFILYFGIKSTDFGYHWDDFEIITEISHSYSTGTFLPSWYQYPSVCYYIGIISSIPQVLKKESFTLSNLQLAFNEMKSLHLDYSFYLTIRSIFFIITSLSIIWIFLLMLKRDNNLWLALLSSMMLGCSWEINYHSTWFAPDAMLMQFGILCFSSLFLFKNCNYSIIFASIIAGICTGTKYTGGVFIILVFLYILLYAKKQKIFLLLISLFIFIFSFLITTPGALLNISTFIKDINEIMTVYKTGHGGHSVVNFHEHIKLNLIYIGTQLFSSNKWIAVFLFSHSFFGIIYIMLIKRDYKFLTILLFIPVFFTLYMSTQKVMIVRNLLLTTPYIFILASYGIYYVYTGILKISHYKHISNIYAFFIILSFLFNFYWIYYSSESIIHRKQTNYLEILYNYIQKYNDSNFIPSQKVKSELMNNYNYKFVTKNNCKSLYIFYLDEADIYSLTANRSDYFYKQFGPSDVNLNYYPYWKNSHRVVIMNSENIKTVRGVKF